MYAVIESGGKQHRVQAGEVLQLEKIESAPGETLNFDRVLLVGEGGEVKIGAPYVAGSMVSAEVVRHGRHDKIRIVKFRRRKHYKRETGHRQWFTEVRITGISAG
jgi:large subunit ribosomal protein L21